MNDPIAVTHLTATTPAPSRTPISTGAGSEDASPIELGDIVVLTEGQGGGSSEDKRRAYNC